MKDKYIILIVVGVLVLFAAYMGSLWLTSKSKADQAKYSSQSWLGSLFNNASDIFDSIGRTTTSPITAFGNAISSIIATSKSDGQGVFAAYGYSDKKETNYGPYIIAGAAILLAGVIIILKN